MAVRFEIFCRDPAANMARVAQIDAALDPNARAEAARRLHDPVLETVRILTPDGPPDGAEAYEAALPACAEIIEVGYLPGVTDPEAATVLAILGDAGLVEAGTRAHTARLFFFADIGGEDRLRGLHNPLIESARARGRQPFIAAAGRRVSFPLVALRRPARPLPIDLELGDGQLDRLTREGIVGPDGVARGPLGLSRADLRAIGAHFRQIGRQPTDAEVEMLAQSWSEHCKHRIFAASLDEIEDGLYSHYIKRATTEIMAARGDGFCVSVFTDNAGAVVFDDDWLICDKVETHNTPSALDPYGGAITGIVGVNRDCLGFGLGAKPILNRYGFCFAEPGDRTELTHDAAGRLRLPDAADIVAGVVRGIEDGGNHSGIPTPQGIVRFDPRFRGKPLVFCGTVGLIPRRIGARPGHVKAARPGDRIVMIGGRVGKDGIHGATASSVPLDESSPATAVQIGDPITQKRLSDVLMVARQRACYTSITDNGAGGLSSSVGEMAREAGGCRVRLEAVPLKYPGLEPWQIWISESQERMTLAVPPDRMADLTDLCARYGVEATDIGSFTDSGRVVVDHRARRVIDISLDFIHSGAPQTRLNRAPPARAERHPLPPEPDLRSVLPALLARPNLTTREALARRFDHEVQGGSLLKPLQGVGEVSADTTAVVPLPDSDRGVAVSQAMLPWLTERDAHAAAALAVDLTIRQLVASGAHPGRIALLDNFCWCSALDPVRLGQLEAAARGCYDAATHFRTPYISGKDSMFNDFRGYDGAGTETRISALPTVLISGLGIIETADRVVSPDFKQAGDAVYLIGDIAGALGAGEYERLCGADGWPTPTAALPPAARYEEVGRAIAEGLVASAIAIGLGGLAVALTRSALGGGLGADIDLSAIRPGPRLDQALFSEEAGLLLLSTAPHRRQRLEAACPAARPIGQVRAAPELSLAWQDRRLVWPLAELDQAYRGGPFRGGRT